MVYYNFMLSILERDNETGDDKITKTKGKRPITDGNYHQHRKIQKQYK